MVLFRLYTCPVCRIVVQVLYVILSIFWLRFLEHEAQTDIKKISGQHSMGGHRIPLEYPLTKNKSE